jgi:hypothetical protein
MAFIEGKEKTGGRKKGSLNKYSYDVKEAISKIFSENISGLKEDLEGMQPKDRWNVLVRILPFVVAKEMPPFDFSQLSDDQIEELFKRQIENK